MTVERASLRRQEVDTANLLSKTEALLREVTRYVRPTRNLFAHAVADRPTAHLSAATVSD